MSGVRGPFAVIDGEGSESEEEKTKEVVFNAPPADETTLMYYVLVKRRPREVFIGSSLFIGTDLKDAKKHVVEAVFGTGFPCTHDEILQRYNVDVVEFDDEWEQKLNDFAGALCGESL